MAQPLSDIDKPALPPAILDVDDTLWSIHAYSSPVHDITLGTFHSLPLTSPPRCPSRPPSQSSSDFVDIVMQMLPYSTSCSPFFVSPHRNRHVLGPVPRAQGFIFVFSKYCRRAPLITNCMLHSRASSSAVSALFCRRWVLHARGEAWDDVLSRSSSPLFLSHPSMGSQT